MKFYRVDRMNRSGQKHYSSGGFVVPMGTTKPPED